jgi:DnaJ-domain-containing protein 1
LGSNYLLISPGWKQNYRLKLKPCIENKSVKDSVIRRSFQLLMADFDPYAGKDAYEILECPRNADKKLIRSNYKRLISTWHPDKVG